MGKETQPKRGRTDDEKWCGKGDLFLLCSPAPLPLTTRAAIVKMKTKTPLFFFSLHSNVEKETTFINLLIHLWLFIVSKLIHARRRKNRFFQSKWIDLSSFVEAFGSIYLLMDLLWLKWRSCVSLLTFFTWFLSRMEYFVRSCGMMRILSRQLDQFPYKLLLVLCRVCWIAGLDLFHRLVKVNSISFYYNSWIIFITRTNWLYALIVIMSVKDGSSQRNSFLLVNHFNGVVSHFWRWAFILLVVFVYYMYTTWVNNNYRKITNVVL